MHELLIDADLQYLDQVIAFVEEQSDVLSMKEQTQLSVAVEEIFVNIASYAYAQSGGKVRIRMTAEGDTVAAEFADRGKPYNPLQNEDPDITLSAEERDIGGLGLLMAKKMTDKIAYHYENGMNILTIQKNHIGG
jgi:anti-sigma regulatory factor (Ser/Thr protein kinase)